MYFGFEYIRRIKSNERIQLFFKGGLQRSASTSSTARGSAATGFRSLAKEIKFAFDRVFDETCSQQLVYEDTAKTLLPLVLKGINATVFAYGATGCGKTHTITGSPSDPGVIYRTMHDLFDLIGESSADYATDVAVSYLEVYNETIRDLLLPEGKLSAALDLREGETIVVAGLSQHKPKTRDDGK